VPTTAIPNGERRDSESSRSGGTARVAADGGDLPGASAAVDGGGGNDDGRCGRHARAGNGRQRARDETGWRPKTAFGIRHLLGAIIDK